MTRSDKESLQFYIAFEKELLLHDYPVIGETMRWNEMSGLECSFCELVKNYGLNVYDVKFLKKCNCVKFFVKREDLCERMEKANPSDDFLKWLQNAQNHVINKAT